MAKVTALRCPNCNALISREQNKCKYCGAELIISPDGSFFSARAVAIQNLKSYLTEEQVKMLRFEELADRVNVYPIRYLGSDWKQIDTVFKALEGTWVKKGKDSHWEVPKK